MPRTVSIALVALLWLTTAAPAESPHVIRIEHGSLSATFRDNHESPAVLSGIDSLFNRDAAPGFDAFDPDSPGASAGMNFEHIISGHENPHNAFSPRHGPFTMRPLADGPGVELVRKAADDPWSVDSVLTYRLVAPHYIDVEFRCRPRDAAKFGRRGYAIFFFCNYMNDVIDPALHFRGIAGPGQPETWIAADGLPGHPDWNGGGTYRHVDAAALEYDADLSFKLNSWAYDNPRYTLPFYYGRAARDMVFILMFDRTCSAEDEIRFSLFKFKLDRFPRPAWDFEYVIRKVVQDREYGYRTRLVWKKFVSPDDCLAEYRQWAASLTTRPE
ncbi:MAG TPA: hypothetical protein PL151_09200 [Phycisphaerae bacterium]|nr:hypothetical protein [Phycisphaerae bacterium]